MFCEAYNQSLKDAAAGGEALSPALQQHLAVCVSCRDAFAEEQNLFAAIDSGLRAAASSEVPATLIPRVHVALNNEPVPQSRSFASLIWGLSGAVVTAAVVFGLLYLPSRRPLPPAGPMQTPSVASATKPLAPSVVNPEHSAGVSPVQRKGPVVLLASRGSKPEFPEVLVSEEERVAFAKFVANASPSSASVSAKAALVPRAPQESVQILPVEIASLEVRPLDPKEERQGQF